MQIAVSLVGIAAMIATATLLNLISIKPRLPEYRSKRDFDVVQAGANSDPLHKTCA
jgi:hypothetical protein